MKINATWWARCGAFVIACCLALGSIACGPDQVRSGARVAGQAALEGKREVTNLQRSGDLSEEEARLINVVLDEGKTSADNLMRSMDGYDGTWTNAAKRRLLLTSIEEFERIATRLEEEGVTRPKSEKAKGKFRKFVSNFRRAASILRIVEAAIPMDDPPLVEN